MKRKPVAAGTFYPQHARALKDMLRNFSFSDKPKEKAICVVSPHAGYMYSGSVAGTLFSSVVIPDTCVIIGPSHRPISSTFALMKKGIWETPLGDVPVKTPLARQIQEFSPALIADDASAHNDEHSLEVQLPFIQFFNEKASIVPVVASYLATYQDLEELGRAIAMGIKSYGEETLIVASTDMSHYVSRRMAEKYDFMAINKIIDLDPRGLHDVVRREKISMCGFQPTVAALIASKILGAKKAVLVRYQTSGEVSGDDTEVVGYAAMVIS